MTNGSGPHPKRGGKKKASGRKVVGKTKTGRSAKAQASRTLTAAVKPRPSPSSG
jgi:hypothetical protein